MAGAFFAAGALALGLWKPVHGSAALAGAALRLLSTVALGLALAARRREGSPLPALLAALLGCALMAATGHVGETMVHAPPEPGIEEPAR